MCDRYHIYFFELNGVIAVISIYLNQLRRKVMIQRTDFREN